ncbi:MAG: hypothetical protein AABX48_04555 [Nanoarchaeota archaeon]
MDYMDLKNNPFVRRAFYLDINSLEVFYYIGDRDGDLIFDSSIIGQRHMTPDIASKYLLRIDPKFYLSQTNNNLNFIQQKLSELEQQAQSAQSQPKSTETLEVSHAEKKGGPFDPNSLKKY